MLIIRLLGMILLAVYLIFSGLTSLMGLQFPHFAISILGLIGIGAGVLILISLGSSSHERR